MLKRDIAYSIVAMLACFAFCIGLATAQDRVSKPGEYSGYSPVLYDGYKLTSQYVTVRDGTKIAVDILRPTLNGVVVDKKFPVVWMNTPYNRRTAQGDTVAESYPGAGAGLVRYGYIVAVADVRGNGASFGKAVHTNRNEWTPWAYWDAYDITEWLAVQAWSDSKIGMWGCSATGHTQWEAAATAPPHLKAIFPMSAPSEYYDWNGVTQIMNPPPAIPPYPGAIPKEDARSVAVDEDKDHKLLDAAKEEHRGNLEPGYMPYRDSVSRDLDALVGWKDYKYWLEVNTFTHLDDLNKADIPAYETAVYGEDERAKLGVFVKLANIKSPMKLVFAPGNHCVWTSPYKAEPTNPFNATTEELRWFDYWLKGVKNGILDEPPIYYYTFNESSENSWKFAWQWPLPTARDVKYYFGARAQEGSASGANNGSLDIAAPSTSAAKDIYPVDYTVTPDNENEKGLTYTTAALKADTTLTGHPVVHLWISSTATDGDFITYLADVGPDGKVAMLPGTDDGRLRASMRVLNAPPYNNLELPYHRAFAEDAKPLTPGKPTELDFDMAPISWVFKAGHRIRLIVTCVAAGHHKNDPVPTPILSPAPVVTFYRDAAHASYISLPVNGPVEASVKTVRNKKAILAELSFPKSLDKRYVEDVKESSVTCNGEPAKNTEVDGAILHVECGALAAKPGAPFTIEGRFGAKYYYGNVAGFHGQGVAAK